MDLIKIEPREICPGTKIDTLNARELWEFVGSKRKFADWIKDRISGWGFQDGSDFTVHKFVNGRATAFDYYLSINMAKELAMVENNDKGRQIRKWFIDRERQLAAIEKQQPSQNELLNNPAALRSLLIGYTERVEQLETVVSEQTPKVVALERIAGTITGEMTITEAAKVLKVAPKRLFEWMRENGWIYVSRRRNVAYQDKINRGLLKENIFIQSLPGQEDRARPTILVTPKGIGALSVVFSKRTSSELPFES